MNLITPTSDVVIGGLAIGRMSFDRWLVFIWPLLLILTLFIIGLYLFITIRSIGRLMEERNPFIRLSGTGLAVLFGLQAFVNMAVAIRLLPAKGMTLPFISYGGSSMLAAGLALGTLLALTRERPHDAAADFRSKM